MLVSGDYMKPNHKTSFITRYALWSSSLFSLWIQILEFIILPSTRPNGIPFFRLTFLIFFFSSLVPFCMQFYIMCCISFSLYCRFQLIIHVADINGTVGWSICWLEGISNSNFQFSVMRLGNIYMWNTFDYKRIHVFRSVKKKKLVDFFLFLLVCSKFIGQFSCWAYHSNSIYFLREWYLYAWTRVCSAPH